MRTFYQGAIEYLSMGVSSNFDLDQAVSITFDRKTWYDTEWVGLLGTTRKLRYLLDLSPTGIGLSQGVHTVYLRFPDNPEEPYVKAGQILVA